MEYRTIEMDNDSFFTPLRIQLMNLYLLNNGYSFQVQFYTSIEELIEHWNFIVSKINKNG